MAATFYDKLLIAVIIAGSIFSGVFWSYGNRGSNSKVNVKQGDKQILQIIIDSKSDDIYPFKFAGGEGKIEVKGNKVRMLPMEKNICPASICSITGWIDKAYQTIVCLPNKIQVQFETNEDSEVDIVLF